MIAVGTRLCFYAPTVACAKSNHTGRERVFTWALSASKNVDADVTILTATILTLALRTSKFGLCVTNMKTPSRSEASGACLHRKMF